MRSETHNVWDVMLSSRPGGYNFEAGPYGTNNHERRTNHDERRTPSVIVRHATRLDLPQEARRVLRPLPELPFGLAVDYRGDSLLRRDLVAALQGREKIFGSRHVLPARAQRFGDLVVAKILLEQVHVRGLSRGLDAPGIVVVDDHHHGHPILRHGLELHARIREARVAGDADDWRALVSGLRTDS